jgi:nitrite reductase/ring-hydroxylating ferredoxin subunit
MAWHAALDEGALPVGGSLRVDLGGQPILLTHLADGWHAVHDTCLHRGASLSVAPLEGPLVTCHLHFWTFDVRDGVCAQVPSIRLRVFPVKLEDGKVHIDV